MPKYRSVDLRRPKPVHFEEALERTRNNQMSENLSLFNADFAAFIFPFFRIREIQLFFDFHLWNYFERFIDGIVWNEFCDARV